MVKEIRFNISTKVLFYFLLVSLLPLIVSTAMLVNSAKVQLLQSAIAKQQIIAADTATKLDNYLENKINAITLLSQAFSTKNLTNQEIDQSIALLVHFDKDLGELSVLNSAGYQTNVFNRRGKVPKLINMADSTAYKFTKNFGRNKNFISSVSFDKDNSPEITIAVPVLKTDFAHKLNDIENANFGKFETDDDFQGIVVAKYNISELWQSVLSTKIGDGGYAYVIDGVRNLVSHPNKQLLQSNHLKYENIDAIQSYINGDYKTKETISETGKRVISTPKKISSIDWAVIVEEPTSSIYKSINSFIKLSVLIIITAEIVAVVLGLVFRKQLTDPIIKLTRGAKQLGGGNFNYKIDVKTNDELQELAETFNNMGAGIDQLVNNLKSNNLTLATEQTKLKSIISSVSDGIVALNAQGKIITINPPAAKLINKKPEDLHGHTFANLFAWESESKHFTPELSKPGLYHYTNVVLPRGNEYLYLDVMVSVLENKDSEVTTIISLHDQTKDRELDFMKLDFVAIAAHELRTPLTVLQGYLDMLNEEAVKQLTIYNIETLQKAVNGSNQLRDLINKLLSISRIERGKLEVNLTKLEITKLVKDIVGQQSSAAAQKSQKIKLHIDNDHKIFVPGDAAALSEVLNNLIGNAIKYTDENGQINVTVISDQNQVTIKTADNGPGIPSNLRARLFTKFYRAERSLIAGSRGTGLGLFISKTIIEMHHGKIGIEPDNGEGSVFYFTLPIYNETIHSKLITSKDEGEKIRGWFKKGTDS